MKFSRHSKNRARKVGVSLVEVRDAVVSNEFNATDGAGNPIFEIRVGGKVLHVVVALDEPEFVITLIEKRNL